LDDARKIADAAFAELSEGLVLALFEQMAWARPEAFKPFVAPLVKRLVGEHHVTLALLLLNFAKGAPEQARLVLGELETFDLPPKHRARYLLERCREFVGDVQARAADPQAR
jgi:hypothetical protein